MPPSMKAFRHRSFRRRSMSASVRAEKLIIRTNCCQRCDISSEDTSKCPVPSRPLEGTFDLFRGKNKNVGRFSFGRMPKHRPTIVTVLTPTYLSPQAAGHQFRISHIEKHVNPTIQANDLHGTLATQG